jgi:hypothetical protein
VIGGRHVKRYGGESSGGLKHLPKSGHKRNTARGLIVGDIMRKHGMNLPQASKYVKDHGLY